MVATVIEKRGDSQMRTFLLSVLVGACVGFGTFMGTDMGTDADRLCTVPFTSSVDCHVC